MSCNPSTVLMVPPDSFQYNSETAHSNPFQSALAITDIGIKATDEFNAMVARLKEHGIEVLILKQNKILPDAVFPNNWFSTHLDATGERNVIIYPMLTKNRQAEVNIEGLLQVFAKTKIPFNKVIDLRIDADGILEGTGSLVLDSENQVLYAALSERTSRVMVDKVAHILDYKAIVFNSVDNHNRPIYHTNVMMSLAKNYAIVCLDAIKNASDKSQILDSFAQTNKLVIDISQEQVNHMCGNVFELFNNNGESLVVVSRQAMTYFTVEQLNLIQKFSILVPVDIGTIETVGGGSARCMMAEIV